MHQQNRLFSQLLCLPYTHTYRYLDYRSFHHPKIKSSVCKTLVHRAHSICDNESINNELDHLQSVLKSNGFPMTKSNSNLLRQLWRNLKNIAVRFVFLTSVLYPTKLKEFSSNPTSKSTSPLNRKCINYFILTKTRQTTI
jgi:hypothetical protein